MVRKYRAEKDRSLGGRASNHALSAILVSSLASPVVAWGADPQQQWTIGDPQGLILTGLKMVGALALILGLMLLSLHFLKRWRSGITHRSPDLQVHILDVRMLAPKKSIALIEVAGERLLLGVGTETVTMLSRIDSHPQQVSAETEEGGAGFAKTLLHNLRRRPQEDGQPKPTATSPAQSQEGQVEILADGEPEVPIRPRGLMAQARRRGDAVKKQLTMQK